MKTNYLLIIVLAAVSFSITGCFGVSDEFSDLKKIVLDSMDRHYVKKTEFSLGSVSLSMLHGVITLSGDDDVDAEMLGKISDVQVGIYKLNSHAKGGKSNRDFRKIIQCMEDHGWQYTIKNYEPGKLTLLFVDMDSEERAEGICVINLEHNELAIVEAHGDLEGVVDLAIRDEKLSFTLGDVF